MRRLKVGIRPQLIILVGFSSLFSLLILGIVTGVYFSANLSQLRSERLEVISQMKTTQIKQSVDYMYYQVYWLSNKETIYTPLTSHRAGNDSAQIFSLAQTSLDQFIALSKLFAAARLYDLYLTVVAESYNNDTRITTPTMDYLFPLSKNATIPSSLLDVLLTSSTAYYTGPMSNTSDINSSYFIGITIPVYANSSIILSEPSISGYLTVLANAANIQSAVSDAKSVSDDLTLKVVLRRQLNLDKRLNSDSTTSTTTSENESSTFSDYSVVAVKPVFENSSSGERRNSNEDPIGFQTVFPVRNNALEPNRVYNINSSASIRQALLKQYGSSTNVRSLTGKQLAIGYTRISLDDDTYWAVIIEQPRSEFLAPVRKLTKIIIGVVFAIGVFMCLITFPLAVLFVRPITKLKEATEAITKLKKQYKEYLKEKELLSLSASTSSSGVNEHHLDHHPPAYGDYNLLPLPIKANHHQNNQPQINKKKSFRQLIFGTPKKQDDMIRPLPQQRDQQQRDQQQREQCENLGTPNTGNLSNRHSVASAKSVTSNSVYSTAIRLPNKIPRSKKFFKDELTELSEAFNIMTEELDKQYTHLEDRVKLRTKELEASKLEAEAANEAKTVFIANISHELRTPLNGILGMTSIAMEEPDRSRIYDSLKLIHRSGELLLHILTELLTYSKNTLNRSKLEKSHFQILEVAYQVQSIFGKLAIDQRVKLNMVLKPNVIRKLFLYGDSNRIIQIVMNLVSNSLKFTPVDGSVDVSFKLLGEYDYNRSKLDDFNKVYTLKNSLHSNKTSPKSFNAKSSTTHTNTTMYNTSHTTAPTPATANTSTNSTALQPNTKDYFSKDTPKTPNSLMHHNDDDGDIELSSISEHDEKDNLEIDNLKHETLSRNTQSALHRILSNSTSRSSRANTSYLGLEDDNISVVTLSTAEYENTIFQSQFNHSNNLLHKLTSLTNKPLPRRPSSTQSQTSYQSQPQQNGRHDSVATVPIKDQDDDELTSREVIDEKEHLDNTEPSVVIEPSATTNETSPSKEVSKDLPKLKELSREELSRNDKDLPELLPPNKNNYAEGKPNNSSASLHTNTTSGSVTNNTSDFSNSEMVKNDKVFKMRNLYGPKTWVVQVEVTDTGPGIEPALQEKVFEPFIQGDQTLSRSYGGTGLGLSICRQLAKMMNGTLTLKSTIGKGSTFTFTVPLPQTGEIMVPEEDMEEFCEDEFNPKSRMNRKVAFDVLDDNSQNDHHQFSDGNVNPIDSKPNNGSLPNTLNGGDTSNEPSQDSQGSHAFMDDGFSHNGENGHNNEIQSSDRSLKGNETLNGSEISDKPTVRVENVDNASTSSRAKSFNTKYSKNSINDTTSNGEKSTFKYKLDIPSRTTLFDKPHLIARSSTGTANSSNASDRADHNLLDDLSHLRILVAEDNMVNQEVIKRMLKLEGFHNLTMAFNGAEAVEFVKESYEKLEYYDMIFMDVQMPIIDGLTATKMIRNNLRYDRPIIALTAFADESNVRECLNSGMSGFLAKPIKRTNLRKIINEFSPDLLNDIITTPQTNQSDEKRLGYGSTSELNSHVCANSTSTANDDVIDGSGRKNSSSNSDRSHPQSSTNSK